MRESKLIPESLRDSIQYCITEDGVWAADRERFDTRTLQSLRTWATRQGWFFSSSGNGVEITVEKQTVTAQMERKMKGRETAFQVTGKASTVRNYIARYNKEHGTGWRVSQVSNSGVFVIYKLPAKAVKDPIRGNQEYAARHEDC